VSEYQLLVVSDSLDQPRIERVVLSPLGAGRYRLDDQDVLGCRPPLFWQDVIEAKEIDDAELRFIRVVQRADPSMVLLELGEDVCTASLTPVGFRIYRLESTQWQVEPSLFYHDLIEADQSGEARFRYVRLAQRSELEVRTMTPPNELIDTAEALSLLNWLSLQGGHWQRDWGNVLVLSIPKDAENEFDNRWETRKWSLDSVAESIHRLRLRSCTRRLATSSRAFLLTTGFSVRMRKRWFSEFLVKTFMFV